MPGLVSTLMSATTPRHADPFAISGGETLTQILTDSDLLSDLDFMMVLSNTPGSAGLIERETLKNVGTTWVNDFAQAATPRLGELLLRFVSSRVRVHNVISISSAKELSDVAASIRTHLGTLQLPPLFAKVFFRKQPFFTIKLDIWTCVFSKAFSDRAKILAVKSLNHPLFNTMLENLISGLQSGGFFNFL